MAPECPLWGAFLSAEGTCGDLVRKHLQGQENSVLLPVARPGLPPAACGPDPRERRPRAQPWAPAVLTPAFQRSRKCLAGKPQLYFYLIPAILRFLEMAFQDWFLIFISKRMQKSPWVGSRENTDHGEKRAGISPGSCGPGSRRSLGGAGPGRSPAPAPGSQSGRQGRPLVPTGSQAVRWSGVRGAVFRLAPRAGKSLPRSGRSEGEGVPGVLFDGTGIRECTEEPLPRKHREKRPLWANRVAGERGRTVPPEPALLPGEGQGLTADQP